MRNFRDTFPKWHEMKTNHTFQFDVSGIHAPETNGGFSISVNPGAPKALKSSRGRIMKRALER